MSRIGNQPITLPAKVEVAISGGEITVKGPLGSLSRRVAEGVTVEKSGDTLVCKVERPESRALHGTTRALLANMVRGVSQGFEKKLSLVGQVAAEIRAYRPPEPYKGKGVRYADERVVIKETKKK